MSEYKYHKIPAGGQKITINHFKEIEVPDNPYIPYIVGDGIGIDITPVMLEVINSAVQKAYGTKRKIHWFEALVGEKGKEVTGEYLGKEALDVMKDFVVSIKGPLTTPVGGGMRSLNVTIRQELDLYSCVRPINWFGQGSPIKKPEDVNYTIWRENTDDIYIGVEWKQGSNEVLKLMNFLRNEMGVPEEKLPYDSSIGIKPTSEYKTKRHVKKALRWTLANLDRFATKENPLVKVTLVHKGNIQKFTEGYFMKWGYDVSRDPEFIKPLLLESVFLDKYKGDEHAAYEQGNRIILNDRIADNIFQQILTKTSSYHVMIAQNLNGDYLSDATAGLVGGLGLAPGANIGDGYAVFEATHGSAPKYAGKNEVNPGSIILSAAFMLTYIGWHEAAKLVEEGLKKTMIKHMGTYDLVREWAKERIQGLHSSLSTSDFGKEIISNM